MQSAAAAAPLHHDVHGSGPPVLLIHGTGADGDAFAGVVEHLERHHRVITYDRRGFSRSAGWSHPPRDYWGAHGDDAAALLASLQSGPASVVAWSGGCLAALELALRPPQRVQSLVLLEPPFHASRHPSLDMIPGFLRVMAFRLAGRKRSAARAFFQVALGRDFARMPSSLQDKLLDGSDAVLQELKGGTGEPITAERLARLSCPLTIVVGGDSPKFLIAASDRLNRMLPRAGVIRVPHAGHAMPVLQPLAFADAISRAISDMGAMVRSPARE